MKKLISGILTAVMIAGAVCAYADVNVSVSGANSGEKVTVYVNYSGSKTERRTVYIVHEDNLEDLSKAVFIGESEAITNSPSYEFEMPDDAENGVYVIIADGASDGKRFVYNKNTSAVEGGLDELNRSSDLKTAIESGAGELWFADTTDSAWKSSAAQVAALAKSLADGKFESTEEVENAFSIACNIVNAKSAEVLEDILYQSDMLGCNTADDEFVKNQTSVMSLFAGYLDGEKPETKAEVQKLFRTACAVSCANNADANQIIFDLKRYNDVLGLDFDGDFKDVDTYELAKLMADGSYSDADDIKKKFNNGIEKLSEEPKKSSGGGGGGGGGAISSAGSFPGAGPELMDEIVAENKIFADVEDDHWASSYIEFVYDNFIMSGDPDGNFRPDDAITREEWTKVILNAFAIETGEYQCSFEDVNPDEWYYPFVARAYDLRIINGIGDNRFGIGLNVSRQDAVVLIERVTGIIKPLELKAEEPAVFTDADGIADYAKAAIDKFSALKIINGYEDGSFAPNGSITRAEGAKIIKTLLDIAG